MKHFIRASSEEHLRLEKSAKDIFFAYTALSFASTDRSIQEGELKNIKNSVWYDNHEYPSLQALIEELDETETRPISKKNKSYNIRIGKDDMSLILKKDGSDYKVFIRKRATRANPSSDNPSLPEVKDIFEYSTERGQDLAAIFANTNFRYTPATKSLGVDIPTVLGASDTITLGGSSLGRLWETQINSLGQMIRSSEEGERPMLIDLATGAGKSFLEAGWFMVCKRAGIPATFAVPDQTLVQQLHQDFLKVVPQKLAKNLKTGQIQDYSIVTHYQLLHEKWPNLQAKVSRVPKRQIMIDEVHLPMRQELYSARIAMLKDQANISGYTATPSRKTTEIFGEPVASFTKSDKVKYGLVQKVDADKKHAALLKIKNKETKHNSPAHEYIKTSETAVIVNKKSPENYSTARDKLRWGLQIPVGEKSLILTDSYDIAHNLGRICAATGNDTETYSINPNSRLKYVESGDVIVGKKSSSGKQEQEAEKTSIENSRKFFKAKLKESTGLSDVEVSELVDLDSSEKYIRYRVVHGLIENYIKAATGLTTVELDKLRQDPEKLEELAEKIPVSDEKIDQYIEKLKENKLPQKEIDKIKRFFKSFNDAGFNKEEKLLLADNWAVDKKLHEALKSKSALWNNLKEYANDHATAFAIHSPSNAANDSLDANKVIKKFHKSSRREASKHTTWEYSVSEVDAMFKAGLIGVYVSSEKIAGFSDPDLQHQAILIDAKNSKLNDPDNAIQAFGRSRGLNFLRSPYFIGVSKQGVDFSLDFKAFEEGGKYDLLAETEKYQKIKEEQIIYQEILEDLSKVVREYVSNSETETSEQTLRLDAKLVLNRHFSSVLNANNHDYDKTNQIFENVIKQVVDKGKQEVKKLEKQKQPKLNGILQSFYSFAVNTLSMMSSKNKELDKSLKERSSDEAKLYVKILRNYDLMSVTKNSIVLTQGLGENIKREMSQVEKIMIDNSASFFSDEIKTSLTAAIKASIISSLKNPKEQVVQEFVENNKDRLIAAIFFDAQKSKIKWNDINSLTKYTFDMRSFLKDDQSFNVFMNNKAITPQYSINDKSGKLKVTQIASSYLVNGKIPDSNIHIFKQKKFNASSIKLTSKKIFPYFNYKEVKNSIEYLFDEKKLSTQDLVLLIEKTNPVFLKNIVDQNQKEIEAEKVRTMFQTLKECKSEQETEEKFTSILNSDFNNNPKKIQLAFSTGFKIAAELQACHHYYHKIQLGEDVVKPKLKDDKGEGVWTIFDDLNKSVRSTLFSLRLDTIFRSLSIFNGHIKKEEVKQLKNITDSIEDVSKSIKQLKALDQKAIKSNAKTSYVSSVDRQFDETRKEKLDARKSNFAQFVQSAKIVKNKKNISNVERLNQTRRGFYNGNVL